jgi:hypothetical protein
MPKPTTIIDDAGFSKLYSRGKSTVDSGHAESPGRTAEPKGTTERVAGFDTVSPFDITDAGTDAGTDSRSSDPDSGSASRRRGRPAGSKNKTSISQNLANLEDILFTIHLSLAQFTFPEVALDESEAKAQADAYRELAKYYNFYIDPKKMAMIQLVSVLGKHYGTRAVAIYQRLKMEGKEKTSKAVPITTQPKAPSTTQAATKPTPIRPPLQQAVNDVAEVPSQIWPESGEDTLPQD